MEGFVKITIQYLYDKGIIDKQDNADGVLKEHLNIEVIERRTHSVKQITDVIQ